MTRSIPYWHVDAFASATFGGNQAAVMMLDQWLPDDVLQRIGEENNFAETAFLVRDETGAADWELRWFTPTVEVVLCGHATLASGHVLLDPANGFDCGEQVRFRTRKSGILEVRRDGDLLALSLPALASELDPHEELLDVLGAPGTVYQCLNKEQETAIVLYESEAAVRALAPDFARLKDINLMVIATAPGCATDIVSRVFVSAYGIDEDSVTGSAHAALTPFWADRLGRSTFTAHQASARGGDLTLRLEGERAWLGGPCVTVVEGKFYLTG
ncbi:PhzF family phenazine biosynthesis protein [Qipengyuania nanhaisediminis]|uniref:PhzF family phenazine biosynthesis protein n=1 Tax=Qipengyuania nanhaisediminis TaxID=604088 RepID=UPI0038B243A6